MKQAFNKFLKGGKKKVDLAPPPPRPMEDIQKDYTGVCSNIGHALYRIKVIEADLAEYYKQVTNLDREAGTRKALDAEAAPTEEVKEVKSE